jgi:small conductance mechanosensitive channel
MTYLEPAVRTVRNMVDSVIGVLPALVAGVLVFLVFWLVSKAVRKGVEKTGRRRLTNPGAAVALGRVAQIGVVAAGAGVALTVAVPSFDPDEAIAVLGIGSVAVGFAFKDILQNFLAGLLILFTEPFRVGDLIEAQGQLGEVEEIQTRATFVKTLDGRRAVVPNAALFVDTVLVLTAYVARRVEVDLSVGYGDDLGQARRLVLEAVGQVEGVASEPAPHVLVDAHGDSGVLLKARWWVPNQGGPGIAGSKDAVLERLAETFPAAGLDIPYPTRSMVFPEPVPFAQPGPAAR